MRRRSFLLGFVTGAMIASRSTADAAPTPPSPTLASLVGSYDGGQMEIAAGLELGSDGRFRYALSYGALDEEAGGGWSFDGGRVLLTSDPVVPPRFVVLAAAPLQAHRLEVKLDLPPGMERQYFNVLVRLTDGRAFERQLGEDGLEAPLGPGDTVASVAMLLPIFGLAGDPVALPGAVGGAVRFRFEPNDLGKVAFAREPLRLVQGGLAMERHGRTILFRPLPTGRGAPSEPEEAPRHDR